MLDYMTVESLVSTTLISMQHLLDEFKREGRRSGGIFNITVILNTVGLLFSPDEKEVNDSILGILREIVKVVDSTTRVLENQELE